jgi:hypothetical protein
VSFLAFFLLAIDHVKQKPKKGMMSSEETLEKYYVVPISGLFLLLLSFLR